MEENIRIVAEELKISPAQVRATATLLSDGATVPFIARYRKEATGSLDEVAVTSIRDRLATLEELDKRRESILKSLAERELLTDELHAGIVKASSMSELEDLYLPYRPKRRTRASVAKEKGLEPLAEQIFRLLSKDPQSDACTFINESKGVATAEDALAGAKDIMAEWISENASARAELRVYWTQMSSIQSTVVSGKESDATKYSDYYEWNESIRNLPSHRILAMFRGENEGLLHVKVAPPAEEAITRLQKRFAPKPGPASDQVRLATIDSYKRLLAPAMETEIRNQLKQIADAEAIKVFVSNIRELLLAPPLGPLRVLAIDPGQRTGCKVVSLNEQGVLLHHDVFYLLGNQSEAERKLIGLCTEYKIAAIAIGNGTGGRETESFVRALAASGKLPHNPAIVLVNESGASIYSASEVAREEFPDHDVTVRGAVSIGRRLIDPLAELVKIDPKSIGVGQYQHDVDQAALKRSLDDVVTSCVNSVGVELNTASKQLLTYVSGLGPQLATKIVQHRLENGPFRSREQLKKVPRLGAKAFEQAAGFLRIRDAENPLDNSAVHPESYFVVQSIANDLGCSIKSLINDDSIRQKVDPKKYVTEHVGLPTLHDILQELAKPGRDPRPQLQPVRFSADVSKIDDLKVGMALDGIVTNVTAFGAFVDIGVHQDGLVHISQLADRYVKDPHQVVKVQQAVKVKVISLDIPRKRIGLSMR